MAIEPPKTSLYLLILSGGFGFATVVSLFFGNLALGVLLLAWGLLLFYLSGSNSTALYAVSIRRRTPTSAFEGDPVSIELRLKNSSSRSLRFVRLIDRFPATLVPEVVLDPKAGLPAGREQQLRYTVRCSRHWGIYSVGNSTLEVSDVLGFFTRSRSFPVAAQFLVFPETHDVAFLHHEYGFPRLASRDAPHPAPGFGHDYLGAREYRPSDERRRIHWPATARHGTLMTKEYETEVQPVVSLFLDLDRRHRAGTGRKSTIDMIVRVAGSVLSTAVRKGESIQLFGDGEPGVDLHAGLGREHLTHALTELIQVKQDGTRSLFEVVRSRLANLPPLSTVVLLSGTEIPDLDQLEAIVHELRGRSLDVFMILIRKRTFRALTDWPLTLEEHRDRERDVDGWLDRHGVPVLKLDSEIDLGVALRGEYASQPLSASALSETVDLEAGTTSPAVIDFDSWNDDLPTIPPATNPTDTNPTDTTPPDKGFTP